MFPTAFALAVGMLGQASETPDPLAHARANIGNVTNQEAVIPPQCYTKTDGRSNPCWTCHVEQTPRNHKADWVLQMAYDFSELGLTNHWSNLFLDLSDEIDAIGDEEMLAYIRTDNYTPFREAMKGVQDYAGWMPDIDLAQRFDAEGFAMDGSWWRSIRFKPFVGTFWPTNGAADEVMIRLPAKFRQTADGVESIAIYKANLAILEASLTSGGALDAPVERDVEPVDETVAGVDLDGDDQLSPHVRRITRLPATYVGAATDHPVRKNLYPKGTEFLHTVRYIDLANDNAMSTRIKEVRYSVKYRETDRWSISRYYAQEEENKDEAVLPLFGGNGTTGLLNEYGWKLQGFIEDAEGNLRAQTDQEHYYCMGCHGGIGVTVDQTFAFPRKVPGAAGWAEMSLAGVPDVPQAGHDEPEILTYFRRVEGGDEFRNNGEILERFFPGGILDEREVRRAATGGDRDIRHLILPSQARSYQLNKAYMALVKRQRFDLGRDPMPTPPTNVFKQIEDVSAGLPPDRIHRDGTLWLDWTASTSAPIAATLTESPRLIELVHSGGLTPIAQGAHFAIYDLGVKSYPPATFLVQSSVTPISLGAEMVPLMDTANLWTTIRQHDIPVREHSPAEVYLYNWVDGAQGAMVFDVGVVVPNDLDAPPPGLLLRRMGPVKVASLLYVGPFPHEPGTGWHELRWEDRARNAGHAYTERLYRELYHHFDYTPPGKRQHIVEVQIEIK